jgi:protein gp37
MAAGTRPFVFCASLADVFDNQVDPEWRADLFELIRTTPQLVWLLLTKRPQNIVDMVKASGAIAGNGTRYVPGNCALGTTIEDQKRADINVPALLRAKCECGPAFVFVSCEPLLEAVDLEADAGAFGTLVFRLPNDRPDIHGRSAKAPRSAMRFDRLGGSDDVEKGRLDWVIAGGETDQGEHKARPTHPDWIPCAARPMRRRRRSRSSSSSGASGRRARTSTSRNAAPAPARPGSPMLDLREGLSARQRRTRRR